MVDKVEVTVTDSFKKHNCKPDYKGFDSIAKQAYQYDGNVVTESFALDKENLGILRAKIMAISIDETSPKKKSIQAKFL
jgi:hypothetical protein